VEFWPRSICKLAASGSDQKHANERGKNAIALHSEGNYKRSNLVVDGSNQLPPGKAAISRGPCLDSPVLSLPATNGALLLI